MSRYKKSSVRVGLTMVLAFLLSVLLFFTALLAVVQLTILNPNFMKQRIAGTDFYEKTKTEIEQKFATLSGATGFEESFFVGVLDQQMLQQQIDFGINSFYENNNETPDFTLIRKDLYDRFYAYADEKGAERTAALEEGIAYLADHCMEMYQQTVRSSYIMMAASAFEKIANLVPIAIATLLIVVILLAVMIYASNPYRHQALRAFVYALTGASLMTLGLPLLVLLSGKIKHVAIQSKALYDLVVSYGNNVMYIAFIAVMAMVVLLLAVSVWYAALRERAKRGH